MKLRLRLLGVVLLILLVLPVQALFSSSFEREILALYKSSDGQTDHEETLIA